ncbi:helix-turn-helix domain-containing protein [Kribbella sp. NPDC051770]|uniref:ArsR/SmtB family transcription factor n=1 Tax=Kribbella sp. NPDC051770 TaxID=3155413 RepID=UPI00344818BA
MTGDGLTGDGLIDDGLVDDGLVDDGLVDDGLWSAIGDPTRRRLLDLLLADGPGTATTLSEQLPVTRQAVAKHLGVLDRAGLVHVAPAGREMRYQVDDVQLGRAAAQLADVGQAWDRRLERIKRLAETIQKQSESVPPQQKEK